jgi:endonuclease/exonuclease/phosphatase family metal-dependent hydrolase
MARPGTTGRLLAAASTLALGISLSVAPAATADTAPGAAVVEVQTYNMDFGGDLSALFAPGADLIAATSQVWAETVASNIPERAAGVAAQIATRQPDLVGLQEVSTWRTAPAAPTSPTTIEPTGPFVTDYDALASLLSALKARGTPYRAVVVDTTFSNEAFPLPAITGTGLRLVAFTDYNVILVREKSLRLGMRLANPQSHTYIASLPVSVAGMDIAVTRGWAQIDVTKGAQHFRFVDTHFEAWGIPPMKDQVRNPQAQELIYRMSSSPYPVVLVGDINARPTMCTDIPRTDPFEHVLDQNVVAYGYLTGAGYQEVWPTLYPKQACAPVSWTSGQLTLQTPVSMLTHRIDDVFVTKGVTPLVARVMGGTVADRTASGLWPSDHASTWAQLRVGG